MSSMLSFTIVLTLQIPSTALDTRKTTRSSLLARENRGLLPTSLGEALPPGRANITELLADPTCSRQPVWIHNGHPSNKPGRGDLYTFMYWPIIATLLEGFEELTEGAAFIDELHQGNDMTPDSKWSHAQIYDAIRTCVAVNKKPYLISVSAGSQPSFLQTSADLGAYLIIYQTEHLELKELNDYIDNFVKLGASEFWDFSNVHVDLAKQLDWVQPYRFMPPGYSRYLDKGAIDFHSTERDEKTLGFLGAFMYRSEELMTALTTGLESSGITLQEGGKVWTLSDANAWVTKYPMQFNMHKKAFDTSGHPVDFSSTEGLETFRLSLLLSNRACIISTLSYTADAHRFSGIVHFASPDDVLTSFKGVADNISSCQEEGYKKFRKLHAPSQILQQSGFLATFAPGLL